MAPGPCRCLQGPSSVDVFATVAMAAIPFKGLLHATSVLAIGAQSSQSPNTSILILPDPLQRWQGRCRAHDTSSSFAVRRTYAKREARFLVRDWSFGG